MKINLTNKQVLSLIITLIILNVLVLAGTGLFHFFYYNLLEGNWAGGGGIKYLLLEFSLGNENTLATWYSSMLFFSVAVMLFLCFKANRKAFPGLREKRLSYGWIIFSLVFLLLSLDEIASLHERIGSLGALNPVGDEPPGWIKLLAIPIVIVAFLMLGFFWTQMKRVPKAVIFAVLGILLFLSVPVHELMETNALEASGDKQNWERPMFNLLLEEGAEIFGAFFMLISTLVYLSYIKKEFKGSIISLSINLNFPVNRKGFLYTLSSGFLLLALLLVYLQENSLLVMEGEVGDLQNWFPAATAFLAFILALYNSFTAGNNSVSKRSSFLLLAIFGLFISALYGSDLYNHLDYTKGDLWRIVFNGIFLGFLLYIGIRIFKINQSLYGKIGISLWIFLVGLAFIFNHTYSAGLTFLAFCFLNLQLLHFSFQEERVEDYILKQQ